MRYFQLLVEYDRNVTKKQFGEKMANTVKTLPSMSRDLNDIFHRFSKFATVDINPEQAKKEFDDYLIDYLINEVEKADPTPNKAYIPWLAREMASGNIKRLEDLGGMYDILSKYDQYKKKKAFLTFAGTQGYEIPEKVKNVFNIQAPELVNLVKKYQPPEEIEKRGKAEYPYNGPDARVIIPLDTEAACYYGQGTSWCTAYTSAYNRFDYYNKLGQLFIIIPKNPTHSGEKYQIHFQSRQLMDEHDGSMKGGWVEFKHRFPGVCEWLTTESSEKGQAQAILALMNNDTLKAIVDGICNEMHGWAAEEADVMRQDDDPEVREKADILMSKIDELKNIDVKELREKINEQIKYEDWANVEKLPSIYGDIVENDVSASIARIIRELIAIFPASAVSEENDEFIPLETINDLVLGISSSKS